MVAEPALLVDERRGCGFFLVGGCAVKRAFHGREKKVAAGVPENDQLTHGEMRGLKYRSSDRRKDAEGDCLGDV